jgi:uncharacterized glyoxalase superfamily protein PhnB
MIMPVLTVRDVSEAMAYYRDKLGFTAHDAMKTPEGVVFFGFMGMGSDMLALGIDPSGATLPADPSPGIELMIYMPEGVSIDDHYAKVKAAGVPIDIDIKTEYWGDRVYTVKDMHGYKLTFAETIKQMTVEEATAERGHTVVKSSLTDC